MYNDDELLLEYIALKIIQNKKKKIKRRFWVRPSLKRNLDNGSELLKDLKKDDFDLVPGQSVIRSSF